MIRALSASDLPHIKNIIASTELFPTAMLEDMTAPYFHNSDSGDRWIVALDQNQPVGVAYFRPETLTVGSFNLLAIAVHRDVQGLGFGRNMMTYVEELLRNEGHRLLLVETSGLPAYAQTRDFYLGLDYKPEAVIRDYYDAGEDKIIFTKNLQKGSQGHPN